MNYPVIPIGRNCAIRCDIVRQRIENVSGGCSHCGKLSPKGNLYQFGYRHDGMATFIDFSDGQFCSRECHKLYHNK